MGRVHRRGGSQGNNAPPLCTSCQLLSPEEKAFSSVMTQTEKISSGLSLLLRDASVPAIYTVYLIYQPASCRALVGRYVLVYLMLFRNIVKHTVISALNSCLKASSGCYITGQQSKS